MNEQDLKEYAKDSIKNGYSKNEIKNILMEEGYKEENVEGILTQVDESKIGQNLGNSISRIELKDNEYKIKQSFIRNKYKVYNSENEVVLKASQKLFKAKESFSFKDSEGEPVFNINAQQILDFSGDYTLKDAETEEPFAVLEKEFTLFQHKWNIKRPDGEKIASITSRSTVLDFLRSFSDVISIIPHKYTVENSEGKELGTISGKLNIRDEYLIAINDSGEISRELLIAAAVSADALEGD